MSEKIVVKIGGDLLKENVDYVISDLVKLHAENKKIILWVAGGMVILLSFLSALWLFGPGWINTASFKEKILMDISREVNGDVQFQKIDFSFFPSYTS